MKARKFIDKRFLDMVSHYYTSRIIDASIRRELLEIDEVVDSISEIRCSLIEFCFDQNMILLVESNETRLFYQELGVYDIEIKLAHEVSDYDAQNKMFVTTELIDTDALIEERNFNVITGICFSKIIKATVF